MDPVLLLDSRNPELRAALGPLLPELELVELSAGAAAVRRCAIWLGEPDQVVGLLRQGLRPQWLQSTWAGYAPLLAADLPRDYRLSRAVGVFGQPIAEYLLAYMLEREQQLQQRRDSQARHAWDARIPGSLYGRRVLIVGAGEIGREVARLLAPFGVRLTGIAHTPRPLEHFERVVGLDNLHEAAATADYIVNILPDTPQTDGIYDAAFFAALQPTAMFFNVGRGNALVDDALLRALREGRLAGAVLDVFREEPLPAGHPFWSAPGLVVTGHIAGPLVPAALARLIVDNLERFRAGAALRGEVDFTSRY